MQTRMDTLTQAFLGAAVGAAAVPRLPRQAMLIGVAAGIAPDLDIIASPFVSEVEAFVKHRSATHSLLLTPIAALLLAPALRRLGRGIGLTSNEWFRILLLGFVTHILLDLCTSYGTQIFWPLSRHPHAFSTVFIIDPFYSLTLVTGLWLSLRASDTAVRRRAVVIALAVSTAYLGIGGLFKIQARESMLEALASRNFSYTAFTVQNTAFNILLWQSIAVGEEGIATGFCRFPCHAEDIEFEVQPPNVHRKSVESWMPQFMELRQLAHFSKGLYQIVEEEELIVLVDLRFGSGKLRPFAFHVGRLVNGKPVPTGNPASRIFLARPDSIKNEFIRVFRHW